MEKVCRRCGRPVENGPEMPDLGQDGLCIDCRLKDECTCPEGRFKIYLPNHSVKIVDFEEYEAVRKIFGNKVFITGNLDEDPRRIKGKRESLEEGVGKLVKLLVAEAERGYIEDEEP